jgi:SAM-dependent methyltransferase
MLEAITPFAMAVRGRFPYALAVEYLPTPADREKFFPVPHCDILRTGFNDGSFDLVVSNDVLEHVPNLTQAMAETRRILRPGGACIATFPFAYSAAETMQRAVLRADGQIQHLIEPPEYHGNPVDPQGSLVFQVPGWDILAKCKALGYRRAEILFVSSAQRGITGAECAGIMILRAVA